MSLWRTSSDAIPTVNFQSKESLWLPIGRYTFSIPLRARGWVCACRSRWLRTKMVKPTNGPILSNGAREDICIAHFRDLTSKALTVARVNDRPHSFTRHTRLPSNGMSHPAFTPQPQRITALWPVLISSPTEGRMLSCLCACVCGCVCPDKTFWINKLLTYIFGKLVHFDTVMVRFGGQGSVVY